MHRLGLRVEHVLVQVALISIEGVQLSWHWKHDQLLIRMSMWEELAYIWEWAIYEGYLQIRHYWQSLTVPT